jgi:hypothetical protein
MTHPSIDPPIRRLALVLRAENDALAQGDHEAAAGLLPEKRAATAALQAMLPGAMPDPRVAAQLRALAIENAAQLTQAIEVQGRILEMVARAARAAAPGAVRYGAHGATTSSMGALALTLRA